MTVNDLITQLRGLDQNAEVMLTIGPAATLVISPDLRAGWLKTVTPDLEAKTVDLRA